MATTITYPTKNSIKYFDDNTVYLLADDTTINQWCTEKSYTLVSYEKETQRFSNDGALPYAFYGPLTYLNEEGTEVTEDTWQIEFGFKKIVISIIVNE